MSLHAILKMLFINHDITALPLYANQIASSFRMHENCGRVATSHQIIRVTRFPAPKSPYIQLPAKWRRVAASSVDFYMYLNIVLDQCRNGTYACDSHVGILSRCPKMPATKPWTEVPCFICSVACLFHVCRRVGLVVRVLRLKSKMEITIQIIYIRSCPGSVNHNSLTEFPPKHTSQPTYKHRLNECCQQFD